jgi:hypothetical protein
MNTILDVYRENKNRDPNNLDLRYMQTSGSVLLHEMMHANVITAHRGHREYLPTANILVIEGLIIKV